MCMLLQTHTLFPFESQTKRENQKAISFGTRRTFRNCYVYLLSCKYFAWITERQHTRIDCIYIYICIYTLSGFFFIRFGYTQFTFNTCTDCEIIRRFILLLSPSPLLLLWFGKLWFVLFDFLFRSIQSLFSLALSVYSIVSLFRACVCFFFFLFINSNRNEMTNIEAEKIKIQQISNECMCIIDSCNKLQVGLASLSNIKMAHFDTSTHTH